MVWTSMEIHSTQVSTSYLDHTQYSLSVTSILMTSRNFGYNFMDNKPSLRYQVLNHSSTLSMGTHWMPDSEKEGKRRVGYKPKRWKVCYFSPAKKQLRAKEVALQLRAQDAYPEDLSLIPSIHTEAHNWLPPVPEEQMSSSGLSWHHA